MIWSICVAEGNVLWDSIALIDKKVISKIRQLGGIHAIAISHPVSGPAFYLANAQHSRATAALYSKHVVRSLLFALISQEQVSPNSAFM